MRLLVALLVILAAPSASALWRDHGQLEPGPLDEARFLWPGASATQERVYFHAYPALPLTGANPNLALLGSSLVPPAFEWLATMGVWRDCNGDGAVGASDIALLDYPAALAPACVGTAHDDAGTIRELLPLDAASGAHAWGDRDGWRDRVSCGIGLVMPEGQTAHTGMLVRSADCMLDGPLRASVGYPADLLLPVHPYRDGESGTPGLLDEDDAPAATVWDCDGGPALADARGSWWVAAERAAAACDPAMAAALRGFHVDLEPMDDVSIDFFGRTRSDVLFTYDPSSRAWIGGLAVVAAPLSRSAPGVRSTQSWTFYAQVDPAALPVEGARLPNGEATMPYGYQYCPQTFGEFDCHPENWWPLAEPGEWLPRPGTPFHLMDRDCLDLALPGAPAAPWPRACA